MIYSMINDSKSRLSYIIRNNKYEYCKMLHLRATTDLGDFVRTDTIKSRLLLVMYE